MNTHVGLAMLGFALFVMCVLMALFAEAMQRTRKESSYMAWRREVAKTWRQGGMERLAQNPTVLLAQVWMLRGFALVAFGFTGWHLVSAIFS
ncbi:hypothetical protein [Rhodobacter maris]|uniref:Uncharacterized protein n=1 Tax=Rhodobacter maris TaxID=446682 RepID=A0A285RJN2_9RHOB|nr:hypothetical protein [Rhodobacter maris]SOB94311.1 hypothetical protein SAMN05877831_101386 [Rhodobacter maris]